MITEAVRVEKVRTLYRQTAAVLITNLVNSALVSAVLWDACPHSLIVGWLCMMTLTSAARAALSRAFARRRIATRDEVWGLRFMVGSAVSGGLWGAAGFLLLEHASALEQLLVSFVIGGMCAAAAGTIACYHYTFEAFSYPALVPLALRMFLFGDRTHVTMALMLGVFVVALSAVARVNQRVLSEAFTLRFRNEQLLKELTTARANLEQANHSLKQSVFEGSEALRVQSELLRDAQRLEAVGRLAGGVAHDFNNLLTIILANLSELGDFQPLGREVDLLLGEVHDASKRGAELVRQLLTFSRRQHSNPELIDLGTAVRSMEKLLVRLLGNGHKLTLRLSDEQLPVFVDPTQMEQVLINLTTNARDAMPSAGVIAIEAKALHVECATDGIDAGTYVVLSVSDTGIGMDD
ncbi:MAG TPA: histidine kinase dimerization/phospho-acceptor domain-containing protein, partial [Polyangiaceae bacterium]|nr:histidine kinase dimerization/phospho-acceptor domain-containing protein [Polyangiaceae bacterium]